MCAANACSYVELTDSMTDRMTPEQRHKCMSHIRGKDTRPEMIVRRWLWAEGFRYRLHAPRLPGKPDIVMRKLKTERQGSWTASANSLTASAARYPIPTASSG